MEKSKIDWCDSTWNPVTGCLHGCEYCYARGISERFGRKYTSGGIEVLEHPYVLNGKKQPYPFGFRATFHKYKLNDYMGNKAETYLYALWRIYLENGCRIVGLRKYLRLVRKRHSIITCF